MEIFCNCESGVEWEQFCEKMLRHHHGTRNFYTVPAHDQGDYGIEFFTADGTIYQCYFPTPGISMEQYKKNIQDKINEDLKKLDTYSKEIQKMLGDVLVNQWVLLTPENKSKQFITYCQKKKNEVIAKARSFVDAPNFIVKIETADSFPDSKIYALSVSCKSIKINVEKISEDEKNIWRSGNSKFCENITRKSNAFMDVKSDEFNSKIVDSYLKLSKFLDELRTNFPDVHELIEECARSELDAITIDSMFESAFGRSYIKSIIGRNKEAFMKHSGIMSNGNLQEISFGYLAKWIAECNIDFKND